MDVRACRKCRKLFQFYGNAMCPACVQEQDRQFNDVKNYLYDNPDARMERVVEDTGVAREDILRWLKEGWLIVNDHATPLLSCETCGKPIHSGRYCADCGESLRRTLEGTAKTMQGRAGSSRTNDERGTHIKR